ncbi:MAG: hypothetical protein ACSLFP_02550 [Acidimicrobiales bacterium]
MAKRRTTEDPHPPDYVLHVDPKGKRWHLHITWAEIDGRWEPVELRVKANPDERGVHRTPLTADDLRRIPLGTILKESKQRHAAHVLRMADKYDAPRTDAEGLAEAWGPRRGRALTRDDLQLVAEVYARAVASYLPVTEAVAEACHVSRSTAGKRIMAARRAGLIPEVSR